MTNHIDTHTDTPSIPAVSVHTDVPFIPGAASHGDTHTDTLESQYGDNHGDISHLDAHGDDPGSLYIDVHGDNIHEDGLVGRHIDVPSRLTLNWHTDTSPVSIYTDTPEITHGDIYADSTTHIDS